MKADIFADSSAKKTFGISGHVNIFNAGILIYRLVLSGFNGDIISLNFSKSEESLLNSNNINVKQ